MRQEFWQDALTLREILFVRGMIITEKDLERMMKINLAG